MFCDGKVDNLDYKDEIKSFKVRNRYYHNIIETSPTTQEKIERLFTSESIYKFLCEMLHRVPDEKTYQIGISIAKTNFIENVSFCNYTTLGCLSVPVLEGTHFGKKVFITLLYDRKDFIHETYHIDCYVINSECEKKIECDYVRRDLYWISLTDRECCKVEKKSYEVRFRQKHPLKYIIIGKYGYEPDKLLWV